MWTDEDQGAAARIVVDTASTGLFDRPPSSQGHLAIYQDGREGRGSAPDAIT